MSDEVQSRQRKRRRLWLALAVVLLLLAVVFVPPLLSLNGYKNKIVQLMSASFGQPVRLASVELRLLPMPGLVLTDLTVEEDPAYGAEPILHASTVTASFRLPALWRGRFEISRISVDDASLNLVRTAQGRWNLDSLFRTAAAHTGTAPANGQAGAGRQAVPLPYLEATESRINFKNGAEKLPLSLVNTDLSFWQEEPGDWRIRLRGQPARTDVSLDLADTGVVRLEASMRRAAELREAPVHLDLEWREAQLGQLARLVIGTDPGWRGDLTGELHLDGTADAAKIQTRLRATGVHRAEFAPVAPMDFDATCGFDYHFFSRALQNLACDSPLGDGRIHFSGELPSESGQAHFTMALDRIPVAAGLDALRTVRSGFAPGLQAVGSISGKLNYDEASAGENAARVKPAGRLKPRSPKAPPIAVGPLTGQLAIDGFQLSGDGLSAPIQSPKLILIPVEYPAPNQGQPKTPAPTPDPALWGSVAIPAGGATPLTVISRLSLSGYQVSLRGQASFTRARELAHLAGMANTAALDSIAGDPVTVDLSAEGPWRPARSVSLGELSAAAPGPGRLQDCYSRTDLGAPGPTQLGTGDCAHARLTNSENALAPANSAANVAAPTVLLPMAQESPEPDSLTGTVTFHNANWKADYLANHVQISKGTLHLDSSGLSWDSVDFSYGPVNGTANLTLPADCPPPSACTPRFDLHFDELDASALEAALLGAHEQGTLISELIAKLDPSAAPAWPKLSGTVDADSLVLGPVTLHNASATLNVDSTGVQIDDLAADLLGGSLSGSGTLVRGDQPTYTIEGKFQKLSPTAVGQLVGLRFSGGELAADGKVELTGFAGKDLKSSAKGTLHFEWRHGAVSSASAGSLLGAATQAGSRKTPVPPAEQVPAALARFDRWTADAEIAKGIITIKQNQVQQGGRKRAVDAAITLGDPAIIHFVAPKETVARSR